MVPNDPKWSQIVPNGPKWTQMVQKWPERLQIDFRNHFHWISAPLAVVLSSHMDSLRKYWIWGHKLAPYGLKWPQIEQLISTFFEYLTAQHCQNIHYMSCGSYYPFQLHQMIQRACCMIVLVSYLLPALICWTAVSWKSCTAITFGLQRKLPPPINPREKSETKFQVIWELCIITKSSNCRKETTISSQEQNGLYNPREGSKYQFAGEKIKISSQSRLLKPSLRDICSTIPWEKSVFCTLSEKHVGYYWPSINFS